MVAPIKIEETKLGTIVASGKGKYIMLKGWIHEDPETKFITEECFKETIATLAMKLREGKFTDSKPSEQGVIIEGSTIIVTQNLKSSGKTLNREQSLSTAELILGQFMSQAANDGYFSDIGEKELTNLSSEVEVERSEEG